MIATPRQTKPLLIVFAFCMLAALLSLTLLSLTACDNSDKSKDLAVKMTHQKQPSTSLAPWKKLAPMPKTLHAPLQI